MAIIYTLGRYRQLVPFLFYFFLQYTTHTVKMIGDRVCWPDI